MKQYAGIIILIYRNRKIEMASFISYGCKKPK